jgi:hypothetical protein
MANNDPTVQRMKAEFVKDVLFGIGLTMAFGGFLAWLIS